MRVLVLVRAQKFDDKKVMTKDTLKGSHRI